MSDCLFCRIAAGEIRATITRRDDRFVAFADIAPKTPVHLLVAALDEAERAGMLPFIAEVAREAGIEGSGFRVTTNHGADARQSVAHMHWHIMGGARLSESM
mgnify:CR=1 FL=1